MRDDTAGRYGAASGAIAIVLFAIGSLLTGDRPAFDASGHELAAHLEENRTRIQLGCAFLAAFGALLVWFLATATSVASTGGFRARRTAAVAYGCGAIFVALFLADVTTIAVSALRPENMAAAPEVAVALRDFEFLVMGIAAFLVAGMLAAFGVLALRDKVLWPTWLGWFAIVAAVAYTLRVGTLFSTRGAFAADGVLGLYIPAGAVAAWVVVASALLTLKGPEGGEPREGRG